ncbi:uncharacterized protein CFP56_029151 [Quercus suber]|uniref:DUF4283 domain-containing protein n=1 Tax=Quercus suber TaxID=58331 RepID=A0AAW0MC57_QUESU
MDDLTISWKKLSLSDKEGKKLALVKNKKRVDFVLAAKFLTKRNVSVDAVAKTFKPLWRTSSDFCICDAGDNHLLFTFELEFDLEKVLIGEPWSFDRHLVVLQRYDGILLMDKVDFSKSSFWVQIHNLPLSCLTPEVALEISESLGTVNKSVGISDMVGGNFMRIQVLIDITKPLSRGRIITLDSNDDRFISFKYERLPNICYWCGMVSHDDKDCSIWLSSKGSLKIEDQQFGNWIRAALVNPSRKSVMDVKGFETKDTYSRVSSFSDTSSSSMHEGILALKPVLETIGEADCNTGADSRPVMEFSPAGDARQREQLQFSEKRLKVVIADLKEDANKEVTLLGNKMTAVANVINEPNVSAISLDGESVTYSQPLSNLFAQGDNDGQIHLHTIGAVMDQEGHQISANLIRASDADFTPGRTDDVMVHEGKDQHTDTKQRALPATQVMLEREDIGIVEEIIVDYYSALFSSSNPLHGVSADPLPR